ncbi:MAG: hypothetical protein LBR00_03040 [Clostridiales Family XIII bacterium]|jgi:hypothetical protein|nr:hypothetical protein [Clostridiales Family XIII bacterium]
MAAKNQGGLPAKPAKIETTFAQLAKSIDPNKINSMEFLEQITELAEKNNVLVLPRIVESMFAPEDRAKLDRALARPDGTVPIDAMAKAVFEIFRRAGELKKS